MRTSTKGLIVLGSTIAIVFGSLFGWGEIHRYGTLYPAPDRMSRFLVSYKPDKAVDAYKQPTMSGAGGSMSQSAGKEYVELSNEYRPFFSMRSADRAPLMAGLYDDVQRQLVGSGARVFTKGGDSTSGFKLDYSLDHSVGSVIILPLAPAEGPRMMQTGKPMQLPPDVEWVTADVKVNERWYPHPGYVSVPSAMVLPAQQTHRR
jgi:hypothetical protein